MGTVYQFKRPKRAKFKARKDKRWLIPGRIWFLALAVTGIAVAENFNIEPIRSSAGITAASRTGSQQANFGRCFNSNQANCVIDGDTIRYHGEKIRLADIDTPEIFSPKCDSEAALGEKATQRLVELINSGTFTVANSDGPDEDRYGRKLNIVQINGRSVGDTLIAEGLAHRWYGARRSWCK